MAILTVIERMRKEQEELSIAIRVFERMSNSHRQNGAMRAAATALALPAMNRNSHRRKHKRVSKSNIRPLPQADAPDGLSLKGVPLLEAIPLALEAVRKPMDSWHLHALLEAAGMKGLSTRTVGTRAGHLAKEKRGVKKTAKGWVAA